MTALALIILVVAAAAAARTPQPRALWRADAVCETGHNPPDWQYRAGSYEGGIAFFSGTWDAWKMHVAAARRYAHAYQAPAWVQAAVAEWGLYNYRPGHISRWGCLYHPDVWALR